MQALNVWMNGEAVGQWRVDRGSHWFRYEAAWLESEHCRPLSRSLPISSSLEITGETVRHYFDNLLPDNEKIRARLGKRFNTKTDIFSLLQAIGRDCVGAVQLLPDGIAPEGWDTIDYAPLSEQQVESILQAIPDESVPINDDELFRISIAGAQEKTALLRWQGQWCRPHGSTPTTHIFKLPLGMIGVGGSRVDASDSVYNEWLCAQIVAALGLPAAPTAIAVFGRETALVVERFDRAWMENDTWIARLPQEDFCQALGVAPDKKYEQHGGPGMQKCLQLLQGSVNQSDTLLFLLTQLAFFLLAAPDGHAKNFSIFLQRGNAWEMTPLYDMLSAWPYLGNGPRQLNRHIFKDIQTRHWHALAMRHGGAQTWDAMLNMVQGVAQALLAVESRLPPDFPHHTWDTICAGMRAEAGRFLDGATRQ